MLDIIKEPDKQKYTTAFAAGEVLFLQGDDSKDMYILVSGKLEVYKDDKKIAEFNEPGAPVGEMSFLLEARRTATIKALTDVKISKTPKALTRPNTYNIVGRLLMTRAIRIRASKTIADSSRRFDTDGRNLCLRHKVWARAGKMIMPIVNPVPMPVIRRSQFWGW